MRQMAKQVPVLSWKSKKKVFQEETKKCTLPLSNAIDRFSKMRAEVGPLISQGHMMTPEALSQRGGRRKA